MFLGKTSTCRLEKLSLGQTSLIEEVLPVVLLNCVEHDNHHELQELQRAPAWSRRVPYYQPVHSSCRLVCKGWKAIVDENISVLHLSREAAADLDAHLLKSFTRMTHLFLSNKLSAPEELHDHFHHDIYEDDSASSHSSDLVPSDVVPSSEDSGASSYYKAKYGVRRCSRMFKWEYFPLPEQQAKAWWRWWHEGAPKPLGTYPQPQESTTMQLEEDEPDLEECELSDLDSDDHIWQLKEDLEMDEQGRHESDNNSSEAMEPDQDEIMTEPPASPCRSFPNIPTLMSLWLPCTADTLRLIASNPQVQMLCLDQVGCGTVPTGYEEMVYEVLVSLPGLRVLVLRNFSQRMSEMVMQDLSKRWASLRVLALLERRQLESGRDRVEDFLTGVHDSLLSAARVEAIMRSLSPGKMLFLDSSVCGPPAMVYLQHLRDFSPISLGLRVNPLRFRHLADILPHLPSLEELILDPWSEDSNELPLAMLLAVQQLSTLRALQIRGVASWPRNDNVLPSTLTSLGIGYAHMGAKISHPSHTPALQELQLYNQHLGDLNLLGPLTALKKLEHMPSFRPFQTFDSPEVLQMNQEVLTRLPSLEWLSLRGYDLSEATLAHLTQLRYLRFGRSGGPWVSRALRHLQLLRVLHIVYPDFRDLPGAVSRLEDLEVLRIEKGHLRELAPGLALCSKLKVVDVVHASTGLVSRSTLEALSLQRPDVTIVLH